MYVPMPITDIALPLRHGMLYKKSVASVAKMLDHYNHNKFTLVEKTCVKLKLLQQPSGR